MLRFLDRANAITLLGLAAGLAAALLASEARLALALVALVAAGICDIFDGLVARRLTRSDEEKRFGQRLDSAVDACSFGVAPVLVLHAAGARHPAELALLGLYAACAVWRLAYFDTTGLEGGTHYVGLPTTFSALVIPLACAAGYAGADALRIAADACAFGLALLMVSPLRIRKPRGAWYGFFLLLAIGVSALYLLRPLP
ncbi:MAG TPA: CDP-alcohol phosphatidyltransferase family protein [Planctomycetota bacterium]|nr:CDP-alcohol phosphatidyltransferase family protein [Planctomycetota bacterium]